MMVAARRWEAAPVAGVVALVSWRALREIFLHATVREAPAAGVLGLPLLIFWVPVLLGIIVLGAVGVHAALRARDARRPRLSYIAGFLVLVLDVFLVPQTRLPPVVSADLIAWSALEQVRARILLSEAHGRLPATVGVLEAALAKGPPAPYLAWGEPVEWQVELRSGCETAITDPEQRPPGTVFYCLSSDRRRAVLSVVGTGGRLAGPSVMASTPEGPVVLPLRALSPAPETGARIDADSAAEIPSNEQETEIY